MTDDCFEPSDTLTVLGRGDEDSEILEVFTLEEVSDKLLDLVLEDSGTFLETGVLEEFEVLCLVELGSTGRSFCSF